MLLCQFIFEAAGDGNIRFKWRARRNLRIINVL